MTILLRCRLLIGSLVCWILSVGLTPVFGQSESSAILQLEELTAAVVSQSAGLSSRELRLQASRALTRSAGALEDPRVSYSVAPFSIGTDIPSDFGNSLRVRQTIQVSQSFPWPGKRHLRAELAEARVAIAEANYDDLLISLVQQARRFWVEFWFVGRALEVNAAHRTLLTDLESVASTRYANGLGLQQDLLQLETNLIELDHREYVLQQEAQRLQAGINDLLNEPAASPLAVPVEQLPELALPGRERLLAWALEFEPELQALEAQSQVAGRQKELAELEDFPDIQISAGYNELWNSSELRTSIGVSVNIPLDFGKRSARKAAAGFEHASAQAEIARRRSKLSAEMEQLLTTVAEHEHSIALFTSELIPKAEQAFAAVSAGFRSGGGSFESLILAQRQLLDLQLRVTQRQANRLITISQIDKLTGGRVWPLEVGQ